MISVDNDILVIDRSDGDEAILPLVHTERKEVAWYIDLGIEDQAVLDLLLDAEVLAEAVPIRYVTRNGETIDGWAHIDELITGEEGNMSRLRGDGPPPAAFLGEEPKAI
jgi:hypothetical protein